MLQEQSEKTLSKNYKSVQGIYSKKILNLINSVSKQTKYTVLGYRTLYRHFATSYTKYHTVELSRRANNKTFEKR